MDHSLFELLAEASVPVKIILGVLAVMTIGCIYVAIERTWQLGKARNQSRDLAAALNGPFSEGDVAKAQQVIKAPEFKAAYLAHILEKGIAEFVARPDEHGITSAARAIKNASVAESAQLNKGIGILATTGATAPFVGLVGTIFGIINAFQGMAESGSGGLASVSAGIAEALVTTAIGISVAILGVWLFNYFTARIEAITNDVAVSTQEIIDWCEKQLLAREDDDLGGPCQSNRAVHIEQEGI